jgi:hypothetical protein
MELTNVSIDNSSDDAAASLTHEDAVSSLASENYSCSLISEDAALSDFSNSQFYDFPPPSVSSADWEIVSTSSRSSRWGNFEDS